MKSSNFDVLAASAAVRALASKEDVSESGWFPVLNSEHRGVPGVEEDGPFLTRFYLLDKVVVGQQGVVVRIPDPLLVDSWSSPGQARSDSVIMGPPNHWCGG